MVESNPALQFVIDWLDSGKEPKVKPNPNFPEGIDINLSPPGAITCTTSLPYPARRIGAYAIECRLCGVRVACTTAGRPDDPRSITIACKVAARV
jgi:hypothetical protein